MKAVLDRDIIRNIGAGETEIGNIPKGVGMERLRFDGSTLVDLATLSQIWVKHLGGKLFELHAVQVPGAQLVDMAYSDRKRLVYANGVVKVPTTADDLQSAKVRALARVKAGFEAEASGGLVTLPMGWDIDCRRSATTNDVQNCEILLKLLELQGVPDSYAITGAGGENGIKGADNIWHPCTFGQLRDVVLPSMYIYGVELYGQKWNLEQQVDSAQSVVDADAIVW